jgi:hypothetical protein
LLKWAKLSTSKYHTWLKRYGKINGHNGKIPRDWWLEEWEKQAILDFHDKHPLEGYRRLSKACEMYAWLSYGSAIRTLVTVLSPFARVTIYSIGLKPRRRTFTLNVG